MPSAFDYLSLNFLPRDAMHSAAYSVICVPLCVRSSVRHVRVLYRNE